ncbi:MAG: hypothetical protein V7709_14975 [Halioglobus sp.]
MTHILPTLPKLIATSVVRGSEKGQSHGGVYTIDFARQRIEKHVDWNSNDIDFSNTGGDRGLRGVAFFQREIFIAASDKLFCYSAEFKLLATYRNPYLRHCHEISRRDNVLLLTSTAYDSLLAFDIVSKNFVWGVSLSCHGDRWEARSFNPMTRAGPRLSSRHHINMVHVAEHNVYLSGLHTGSLLQLCDDMTIMKICNLPAGTHNAQPFQGGFIYNNTRSDAVSYVDCSGNRIDLPVIRHPKETLQFVGVDDSHIARQSFGRGLCAIDNRYIAGGSSPSTISVYDLLENRRVATINLTRDIRNAIHGLEVWPF